MRQPIKPPLKTPIAPEPILAMEEQPERQPGEETQQYPQPGHKQIDLRRVHIIPNTDYLARIPWRALIDKTYATIVCINAAPFKRRIGSLPPAKHKFQVATGLRRTRLTCNLQPS